MYGPVTQPAPPPPAATPTNRFDCLTVLRTENQVVNQARVATVNSGPLAGLPNVKSVCDEVCARLHELEITNVPKTVSEHRLHALARYNIEVGNKFPAHGTIRVDDKSTAADVTEYINQKFNAERFRYPRVDGWQAITVVGGTDFGEGHPFFRYRDHGKLDSKCARIIVVVDRAIEGMNNKFLLVEGIAGTLYSHRKNIQARGRLLRSAAYWTGLPFESTLVVPPRDFDRIYVVTHEAFFSIDVTDRIKSNEQSVINSLDFIADMARVMTNVMTLDQYVSEDHEIDIDSLNWRPIIDWTTAIRIAQDLGDAMLKGQKVSIAKLITKYSPDTEINRRFYRAVIESGISGRPMPYDYKKDGRIETGTVCLQDLVSRRLRSVPPAPRDIVYEEVLLNKRLDLVECREWATRFNLGETLGRLEDGGEQVVVAEINKLVDLLDNSHRKQELMINETPAARVAKIINDLASDLNASDLARATIEQLIHDGVFRLLERQNIQSMSDLAEDGALCKPTITYELRQTDLETELRGWVVFELLQRDQIATLAAVLALRK